MSGHPRAAVPAWLPSPVALVLAVSAVVLVMATLARGLIDADLWWHLRTGELIAETASVPSTDPFSFTYGGAWTPHEWLSELLLHFAIGGPGRTPTLVVFGLLGAASLALPALALSRQGIRTTGIGFAVALAGTILFALLTVRPQAISWFLLGLLLTFLMVLTSDRPRWAWLLVPLFVVWANLHGLYVVGLGVVAVYTLFTLTGQTAMAPARGTMLLAAAGALAASALTPAGPAGLLYPLRYLEPGDWGLANIQEWQSPDFHDPAHWGLLLLIVVLLLLGGRGTRGWMSTLAAGGVVMALLSQRNAPIAAILSLPVIAMGIDAHLGAARPARNPLARRVAEIGLAVIVIVAAVVRLGPGIGDTPGIGERYPVAAVDVLARSAPDARLIVEYGWAGYAIYRLHADGGRVFVDGRNDMYPQSILEEYSAVRAADDGWEEILDRYDVDAILLPPIAPLVRGPAHDAGWCDAYHDPLQVLLLRSGC